MSSHLATAHSQCKKPTLVVVVGPTGVGKTALSIFLAKHYGTEVLSADSRQLYRQMDVGTATPTLAERSGVPHHFINCLNPDQYYSAAMYEQEALHLLASLFLHHNPVVLCGGSMLYVDAVCRGIDDMPDVPAAVRGEVWALYDAEGLPGLRQELQRLDPIHYAEVDLNNHKRLIHAIEICRVGEKPYSAYRTNTCKERPFNILKIGLNIERPVLYDRINARVDEMMKEGLLEEVRRLQPYSQCNATNTVGYKELFAFLKGECGLEEAVARIKGNTRRYARKQLTWFKRDPEIHWFHPDEVDAIIRLIDSCL